MSTATSDIMKGVTMLRTSSRAARSCTTTRVYRPLSSRIAALQTRPISSTSIRLQQQQETERRQEQGRQASQTYYDLFPDTFAKGAPPKSPFTPDLKVLRKEFLQLQAKAHPDLAPSDKKRQAEAMSARINEAYKTLQDPLHRARYLLSLENIDLEDDAMKLEENELLMEVMEAREAVDEVENEDQLVNLKSENQERIDETVNNLEQAFAARDLKTAAHHAIRLRYWKNIEESIQGWEKGQGGGMNHH